MSFGVRQLNRTNATKVVEVSGNLIIGSAGGEWVVFNEQICLSDVGCGDVVAEKQDDSRRLDFDILA